MLRRAMACAPYAAQPSISPGGAVSRQSSARKVVQAEYGLLSQGPVVATLPMDDVAWDAGRRRSSPGDTVRRQLPPSVRALIQLTVAAVTLIVCQYLYSYLLFGTGDPAVLHPKVHLHVLLNAGCNAVVAALACQFHGRLHRRLRRTAVSIMAVHGLLLLMLLADRAYFSRSVMFLSGGISVIIAYGVALVRQALDRPAVAVIAPKTTVFPLSWSRGLGKPLSDASVPLTNYDIVLVDLGDDLPVEWVRALSKAMIAGVEVRHIAEYLEEMRARVSLEHFDADHLSSVGGAAFALFKRMMDIVVVLMVLPVVLPVLCIAMAAILITMGRPIFFNQDRVGRGGAVFHMYKLRTMRPAPERAGSATATGDNRITPLGALLRRFRIDELPQLLNVLKGDMSLIGPRPEQPGLTQMYTRELPAFEYRHLVRPGITGWAQVRSGYAATLEETRDKLAFDLFYIKNFSLWLDMEIVFRTVWTLVSGRGVR